MAMPLCNMQKLALLPIPAYAQDRTLEPPQHFSEDCLTLNIWRPAHSNQPLPVLFWIYGGAYAMGNAAMALYSGEAMAREGAVIVSANYRVGLFGFCAPFPAQIRHQRRSA